MNNFWVVFSHTYLTKVKSKQFIISTAITVLVILLMTNITTIIDRLSGDEEVKIAAIDETNQLFEPFQQILTNIDEQITLVKNTNDEEKLKEQVLNGELDGYIFLTLDESGLPKAIYKAESITDQVLIHNLEMALQQIKSKMAAEQLHLTDAELAKLNEPIVFEKVAIGENVKSEEELSQARGLVYALLFVIYFAVIMYANMIATEVATEKSSRVMEILISSVSPVVHMFAKIIGVACVGFTQLLVILGVGYFSIKQNLKDMTGGFFSFFGFENTSVSMLIYAIVFFILGYLLYATIAAFLGSLVSRIEDVQQMISPLSWIIVIGFMLAIFGLGQPDATYVTVTSFIPLFTPMLMFLRVSMLDLPLWEILLGISLLIATIIVLAIIGARIYKGGVLLYGKTNLLKDLKKALQLTKEN